MSSVIFTITPASINYIMFIMIVPAIIVVVAGIAGYNKQKAAGKKSVSVIIITVIIGAGIVLAGYFIQSRTNTPATVEIGNHFIQIDSSQTGRINETSSQISTAYVSQIGTGSLTLSRQHGLSNNVDKIGVFTLGNGATAYVVSTNSTDLIIKLTSGYYMVIGCENLTQIVALFSQNVFPVSNSS